MSEQLDYVEVGEKKYAVIKIGRAQAEQVLLVTKWIAKHGIPAFQKARTDGKDFTSENAIAFISDIVEYLTADALIDLFTAMVGCSKEESELYFDISILVEVVIEVYNRQPAVRRLLDRFFFTEDLVVELPESSTTSE